MDPERENTVKRSHAREEERGEGIQSVQGLEWRHDYGTITTVQLLQPDPARRSERAVSVRGRSDVSKPDFFLLAYLISLTRNWGTTITLQLLQPDPEHAVSVGGHLDA